MRTTLIFILFLLPMAAAAQQVPVIKITDLEKRVKNQSDTTYVVNFWATWCKPCVAELPSFDSIYDAYQGKPIKVLLVTMDFKEDIESKVIPFIKNKMLKPEVLLLDELNGNYFIPRVSEKWSGAIPATWILNGKYNYNEFWEKKVNFYFLKFQIDTVF